VANPKPSNAERACGHVTVLTSARDFGTGGPAEAPEPVFDEFYSTKKKGMVDPIPPLFWNPRRPADLRGGFLPACLKSVEVNGDLRSG